MPKARYVLDKMGKKLVKCKAPGCAKWVKNESTVGFCSDHGCKLDPVSALYIDRTPRQIAYDERVADFFTWLLHNRSIEELLD